MTEQPKLAERDARTTVAALRAAHAILDKAFINNWVMQDTLDAILALIPADIAKSEAERDVRIVAEAVLAKAEEIKAVAKAHMFSGDYSRFLAELEAAHRAATNKSKGESSGQAT